MRPAAAQRPDTEQTVAALAEAERQAAAAESSIVSTRAEIAQILAASTADTAPAGPRLGASVRNRQDSLTAQVDLLGRLLARSENAPLLGSYRALAQSQPMQGDVRVKQLLDSLVEIERERDSYSAVGGVDPVFVALTARANELGHNIEVLADARRAALRRELSTLAPSTPATTAITQRSLPDTAARVQARDGARAAAVVAAAQLAHDRAALVALDAREERARELANVGASPTAMLAAALVFGAVLGFGVALFDEVRRPRLADAYEAERATGVRVLGVIRPLPPSPERGRRASDRSGPPHIDPGGDGHQLIYLTIATAGSNTVMLTITGDNSAVAAIVAINFAAIAADEARSTLLIGTDGVSSSVAAALRLRASAGISGLVKGTAHWPEVTRSAKIGRDRTIDVVPSGEGVVPIEDLRALLQRDITRLSRHYDAIILVSSIEQVLGGLPTALPIPDVLYCARVGLTPIAELKRAINKIEDTGAHSRGIVLWNAPDPVLAELRPTEEVEREPAQVA
jgi:Mrp family chromosome partitioning ATPase